MKKIYSGSRVFLAISVFAVFLFAACSSNSNDNDIEKWESQAAFNQTQATFNQAQAEINEGFESRGSSQSAINVQQQRINELIIGLFEDGAEDSVRQRVDELRTEVSVLKGETVQPSRETEVAAADDSFTPGKVTTLDGREWDVRSFIADLTGNSAWQGSTRLAIRESEDGPVSIIITLDTVSRSVWDFWVYTFDEPIAPLGFFLIGLPYELQKLELQNIVGQIVPLV